MRLPSGYSTYDYSVTAEQKGWGKGWALCTAGPTVTITLARSGTKLYAIHKRIAPLVALCLNEIERRGFLFYNPGTWGGACRAISGTRVPSNHSWFLAFDMNAPDNPYTYSNSRTIPDWAFAILRAYGFGLGADYVGKKDWMHAEFMGTPEDADVMTALAMRNFGGNLTAANQEDDMANVPQDQWDALYKFVMEKERAPEGWAHSEYAADRADEIGKSLAKLTEALTLHDNEGQAYPFGAADGINNNVVGLYPLLHALAGKIGTADVDEAELGRAIAEAIPDQYAARVADILAKRLAS